MVDHYCVAPWRMEELEDSEKERDEMRDEIKRIRAELAAVRRTLTLHANERLRAEVAELRSELARYQTPNVDNCVCHETSTRNCSVHQNDGGNDETTTVSVLQKV